MEYSIATYFMLFIIYAVAGWICEVTLQLIQKHKLADRNSSSIWNSRITNCIFI